MSYCDWLFLLFLSYGFLWGCDAWCIDDLSLDNEYVIVILFIGIQGQAPCPTNIFKWQFKFEWIAALAGDRVVFRDKLNKYYYNACLDGVVDSRRERACLEWLIHEAVA